MINVIPKNYFNQIDEFELQLNNNKNIIGTGSFGVVKMALHKGTNKIYAIKIIDLKKIESLPQLKIIERQIKLHSSLDHPHIVKLWDTLVKDSMVYMIMQYCQKGNLFYYQNSKIKFTQAETFQYFYQCAKAIEYIHKHNIIHRDIKPQNLLLDKNFNLKICDFGWSAQDVNLKRNTFCGTYQYMAPQMILKKPYNYKIDIWGLGVLLFELLHGHAPFRGNNLVNISSLIQKGEYQINNSLSQSVKSLIKSILQFDPDNRPDFIQIFQHEWIKKMKLQINNFLKKEELPSNILIVQKIGKIVSGSTQKLVKKRTHKKAQSANQIYNPTHKEKKSIQINFSINNYELLGMKNKLKKKGDISKRCKTMTEQSMKRLGNIENYQTTIRNQKVMNQYLQTPKNKTPKKSNFLNFKSPKQKVEQRINTQVSEKVTIKKKKIVEQTLHKVSSQHIKHHKKSTS